MANIKNCLQTLEKLSLLTCSETVLPLLERALINVEPVLKVDTRNVDPLLWQNELTLDRLHPDQVQVKLGPRDLEKNAPRFFEDYIAVGLSPEKKLNK